MTEEAVVDNVEPVAEAVADNPTPTPEASGDDWRTGLPEDLKANKTFEKFSSVEALAGSYANLERHLGNDRLSMPESDEDWGELYTKLGRPEDTTGYALELAPEVKEKVASLGAEENGWFLDLAHKAGLNQTQAQQLYEGYWDTMAEHTESMGAIEKKAFDDGTTALKKEWLGDTDKNTTLANRALTEISEDVFGDDTFVNLVNESGLGNDPRMAKVLFHLAKGSAEDGSPEGIGDASLSADSVKMRISEIQKSTAYMNKQDPAHKATVREMHSLYEMLHPGEAV